MVFLFWAGIPRKILILNDNKTIKTKKILNYNFFCFVQGANFDWPITQKKKKL